MEFERAFVQAGGLLIAGADPTGLGGVIAGFGDQREVELLVEAASRPSKPSKFKLLTALSSSACRTTRLSRDRQTGRYRADQRRPSANIQDIEKVEVVSKTALATIRKS